MRRPYWPKTDISTIAPSPKLDQLGVQPFGSRTVPDTYDADAHTVDAIVATQTPIQRHYGIEELAIRRDTVDLSMLDRGRILLLDSHDPERILGSVVGAWFENQKLYATLRFDQNRRGRAAEEMVARGELWNVSCATTVTRWSAMDADGNAIRIANTDFGSWAGDREGRLFTAERWALAEVSLTSMPVDTGAVIL
jgi:phage head maturation protease